MGHNVNPRETDVRHDYNDNGDDDYSGRDNEK